MTNLKRMRLYGDTSIQTAEVCQAMAARQSQSEEELDHLLEEGWLIVSVVPAGPLRHPDYLDYGSQDAWDVFLTPASVARLQKG